MVITLYKVTNPACYVPESKPVSGTVSTRKQTGRAVMKMQTNRDNELVRVGMNRMQLQHKQLEKCPTSTLFDDCVNC
jgi:hypothetical protein